MQLLALLNIFFDEFNNFVFNILGLKFEEAQNKSTDALDKVINLMLNMRTQAKLDKNFTLSDEIRNKLTDAGIQIKDSKEGSTWKLS